MAACMKWRMNSTLIACVGQTRLINHAQERVRITCCGGKPPPRQYHNSCSSSERPRPLSFNVPSIAQRYYNQAMSANTIKPLSREEYSALLEYSACDVSDALLKLKVPGAGFLADISVRSPFPSTSHHLKVICPASTVLFITKSSPTPSASNIPSAAHFADLTPSGSIVVISQPAGQRNAVLGGLVAARIKTLGAQAVVVDGRVRDLQELREGLEGFPVWAKGTSTVGAGAESKAVTIGGEVEIEGVKVNQNDIIVADGLNGVVCIPRGKLGEVLELLPRLTGADGKVRVDVVENKRVLQEAFAEHRNGL